MLAMVLGPQRLNGCTDCGAEARVLSVSFGTLYFSTGVKKTRHGMREGQLESNEGLVGFEGVFEHRLIWRER